MLRTITARRLEYLLATAISLVALGIYFLTMCPTVNFIDSGELATVAYTLGIAHPTGYPLFTLAGWLISHLPLGLRTITQLNAMAALFCASGLFAFFRLLVFFLNELLGGASGNAPGQRVSSTTLAQIFLPAAAGTLVLGFSETYWSQALSIEVYPLHVLLLSVVTFLFLKACTLEARRAAKGGEGERYWLAFALVLGLSFANHMTTILLAPAFLYLFFYTVRFGPRAWRRLARLALPFLLGLSLYLYLPVRATQGPTMNWGNPVDLERILWHVSGRVYRVWIFASGETAGRQFNYFLNGLPAEFAYLPLAAALAGLLWLFSRSKQLFLFTLLLFVGCLLYAINYDISDIDSYFLLAYLTIALWSALGVSWLAARFSDARHARIASVACVALTALLPVLNAPRVNEHDNRIVEEYTLDMFRSMEPNAILISAQWDYFVSAAYYLQLVEHVRPDVTVIDKELLRRSWYYAQLSTRYPALTGQSRREIDALLPELGKFERELPYNPTVIEFRYAAVIRSFIERNYRSRPVYVTQEIGAEYMSGLNVVPSGLALRVFPDTLRHESPRAKFTYTIPNRRDKYVEGILAMYAQALFNNALASSSRGKQAEALGYLDEAVRIQPGFRRAAELREALVRGG